MKNITLYLLTSAFICLIACEKEISPSGSITKVQKTFSNYSSIEIESGFNAIITSNNSEKVEIETNENIQQYVIATQTGNKITFKRADNIKLDPNTTVKIYISAIKITELFASGGSSISTTNQFETDNLTSQFSGGSLFTSTLKCLSFTTTISGGSKLNLTGTSENIVINSSGGSFVSSNINCINFTATTSEGSHLNLSGTSDNYFLNSTGGSNFDGFNFIVKKFTCNVSGVGIGNVTVNEKLDVTASGGSIINYKGTGVVNTQNLTGGAKLNKL